MSEHEHENPAEGHGQGEGVTSDLPHFEDGGEAAQAAQADSDASEQQGEQSSGDAQRKAAGSNAADGDYRAPEYGVKSDVGGDAGEAEVQERFDRVERKGFFGVVADPTPNEAYTLKGVTEGQPTPETDEEAARSVGNFGRFAGDRAVLPNGEKIA